MNFLASIIALYKPDFAGKVVGLLQQNDYRLDSFMKNFWSIDDLSQVAANVNSGRSQTLRLIMGLGSVLQLAAGVALVVLGANGSVAGGVYFGAALIISYPLVWAHLILLPVVAFRTAVAPKAIGKKIILSILGRQVRQLRAKYDFKVIAVAGSVGKTSTKFAIAQTLDTKLKVRWQQGNYNDPITAPLVIFGHEEPGIYNILAWFAIFRRNRQEIKNGYDWDAVVLELGTDGPGQIEQFSKYLRVDIGVITAIAPEHMEFFGSLDAVAEEELSLAKFTDKLLISSDLTSRDYLSDLTNYKTYGFDDADCTMTAKSSRGKYSLSLSYGSKEIVKASVGFLNKNQLYGAAVAAIVASELGFTKTDIKKAISSLQPVSGRLKPLEGLKNSTILDDSYNSAPEAALAALETLYRLKAPQKIAILGSMNELGEYAPEAHQQVGAACDPKKLDLVVTVGTVAKQFLAPAAKAAGCEVRSYDDPVSAGKYIKKKMKAKALVLAKGSQNGVFTEEAVKVLLKDRADADQLVRQSAYWLAIKQKQFDL